VGRSVDNWSPFTGDTATGVESVTGPEVEGPVGGVGDVGTWRLPPVPLPHPTPRITPKPRNKQAERVNIRGPNSSNNQHMVNLFIENQNLLMSDIGRWL
jgi:hypothetical protein